MKIYSILFSFLISAAFWMPTKGQTIFFEDFQSGSIPPGFTLIDNDGLTPAPNVAQIVTAAWSAYTGGITGATGNYVAISTSWYDPAGQSDDWLITPPINLTNNNILSWVAKAQDPSYPDGYEVRISTTGLAIGDFMANPPLFAIGAEQTEFITREVNLGALGYANQQVYIAFRNNSNDMFLLLIDDILVRAPFPVDATVTAMTSPTTNCFLSNAERVTISLNNVGVDTLTGFNLNYQINNGPVVTETFSDSLFPFTPTSYIFSATADLSMVGSTYTFNIWVSAAGDGDLSNDSIEVAIVNVATKVIDNAPYSTGFETFNDVLGWDLEDSNMDGSSWGLLQGATDFGSLCFAYSYDAANNANDWLFSTCMDLTAGNTYRVKFFYAVQSADYPEKLMVMMGTSKNSGSMTDTLVDLGQISNEAWMESLSYFTPTTTGTYYLGFKAYSDADMWLLKVDEVEVRQIVPPVASFNYTANYLAVNFSSTSTNMPTNWAWDFGNGSTGVGSTISHTYDSAGTYNVCLTVSNQAGTDTKCENITVEEQPDDTIGIALPAFVESLDIFPNPASSALNVVLETTISGQGMISLHDIAGRAVLQQSINGPVARVTFNTQNLAEGAYFVNIRFEGMNVSKKVFLAR